MKIFKKIGAGVLCGLLLISGIAFAETRVDGGLVETFKRIVVNGTITMLNGAVLQNAVNNTVTLTENSDIVSWVFAGSSISETWTGVTSRIFGVSGSDVDIQFLGTGGANLFTLDYGALEASIGSSVAGGYALNVYSSTKDQIAAIDTAAYNASPTATMVFRNTYKADGSTANMGSIRVAKENTTVDQYGGYMSFYTRAHGSAEAEAMRIDSSQRVLAPKLNYAADAGSSDAYAITLTGYTPAVGSLIIFRANTANTGACTLNVNGAGAVALKAYTDQDPPDNYIEAGSMVMAVYSTTTWQIQTPDANP